MSALSDALAALPEAVYADLLESDTAYRLVFDMPGVTEETLEVRLAEGRLSIEARREKAVPDGFWFRHEDRSLFLDVEIPLPPDAADDGGRAHLDGGVLEVTVPKSGARVTEVPIEG